MSAIESRYHRVIDANYNRAKEAVRVCEDISRFFLDDVRLTAKFKQSRHALTKALLQFPVPYRRLVAARDSAGDVGKKSRLEDLERRPRVPDLMAANLKRAEEAVRVLEEFSKIVAPRQSPAFQKIRFHLYELEKIAFRKL